MKLLSGSKAITARINAMIQMLERETLLKWEKQKYIEEFSAETIVRQYNKALNKHAGIIVNDLSNYNLIKKIINEMFLTMISEERRSGKITYAIAVEEKAYKWTTDMGDQFLRFIESPAV